MIEDYPFWRALFGGMLVGASLSLFYLLQGRIAGISGVVGNLFSTKGMEFLWRLVFLLAIVIGTVLISRTLATPEPQFNTGPLLTVLGGLLVGFGTRLGSGCTSGHGVCGLARLSLRSLVAVAVFMAVAILTVLVKSLLLGATP